MQRAAHIQLFFGCPIRFAVVPVNRAFEAHGGGHLFGQLSDAQIDSRANVKEGERCALIVVEVRASFRADQNTQIRMLRLGHLHAEIP